jgi:hypothetical protein
MNDQIQLDVLPENQLHLFHALSDMDWLSDFYLAGGTALALQLGHRQSIDFDLFKKTSLNREMIKKNLRDLGTMELYSEDQDTIHVGIDGIRISFFNYGIPILGDFLKYKNMFIAPMLDIALMKLAAISGRGSKKDFIDLYFLLDHYDLSDLFKKYQTKFGKETTNLYHLLKSLVYFDDAEQQPQPILLKQITWQEVKNHIVDEVKKYSTIYSP